MASSPIFRELILSWALSIGSPTRPTTFYVSFHTADPSTTGANEGAIPRTQHDAWAAGTAGDGEVENDGAGESAAATGVFTATHFGVWSASSGGSYYFGGALSSSQAMAIGEKLSWADGALAADIS